MKKKECPSCAMEIDEDSKVCPICEYEFPVESKSKRWILIALIILFILMAVNWFRPFF